MKKTLLFLFLMIVSSMSFAGGRIISDTVNNGTRIIKYQPDDLVCASLLEIRLKGNTITFYKAVGGCNGNGKGIAALLKGLTMDQAISKLDGITCGNRPTSCPDQLAQALKAIKAKDAK